METYISLLRGINVSGQKKIDMKTLKELFESLKLKKVKTYIQSGNVVFKSDKISEILKKEIEKKIKDIFKFEVGVIIRNKIELKEIINNCPFKENIYVTFMSDAVKYAPIDEINKFKDDSEQYFISNKEIYLSFPNGYGKTKLSNTFFEKKLKTIATTRNWNTVNTLFEMASKG